MVGQCLVHGDLRGIGGRLVLAAMTFAGGECRLARQPIHLRTLGALARRAQCHVDAVELDVNQLAAGANALELQIAVLADHVLQVATEGTLAVDGSHRDWRIPDDDGGALLGVDDLCAVPRLDLLASVDVAGIVTANCYALRADGDHVRALGNGAAPVKPGAQRRGSRIERNLVDEARVERALELIEAGVRGLCHEIGMLIGALAASAPRRGSSRLPRPTRRIWRFARSSAGA